MKKLLLLLISMIATLAVNAQNIEGSWLGKLEVGQMELNLVFNFTKAADGKLACTMDSPDQGAKGIAAEVVSCDSANIKISVTAIGATYEAKLTNDELQGTFTQNGFSLPLNLKRGALVRNRLQTPQPPYPYTTEEVAFSNDEEKAVLAGTLTMPVDYNPSKPVPVVIMVTGSGMQNRDEEIFEHKPFLVIADYLARNGIASLRYDDRGFAKSTGNYVKATTEDFMKDAAAGVEWLRSQGNKFSRVGVIGHSEGATIAFMLASKGKVDFMVSLAGPGVKGDTILARQMNVEMERHGQPASMTIDILHKQIEAYNGVMNEWQKFFINYDPIDAIAKTRCPVMALQGSKDRQVEQEMNFPIIEQKLPKNKNNLLKTYEGLNHLFQHCTTGYADEYSQIEETISNEVLSDIAAWILRNTIGC